MSNSILEGLVKQKDLVFKKQLFKMVLDLKLTLHELLLIIYFINQNIPVFDIDLINETTCMTNEDIMTAFSSLTVKGVILISILKNADGSISEIIDLNNVYKFMVSDITVKIKQQSKDNIFTTFEKEFGRALSPIEFEIINAWLKSNIKEELIIGALKEATFNGVSNLRYIDKIIYEWTKKGFKCSEDVNNHLRKKEPSEAKVLFDYNWLEDGD